MLIVACQVCGESKIIAGTPDGDGMARATWICPFDICSNTNTLLSV